MEKESLEEATKLILDVIHGSNINLVDKLELMMNLNMFLTNYDEAIKQRFNSPQKLTKVNCKKNK